MHDVSSLGRRSPLFTAETNTPPTTTAEQIRDAHYSHGRYGRSHASPSAAAERDALAGAWAIYLGHLRSAPADELKRIAVQASVKAHRDDPASPSSFLAPALESARAALEVVRRADTVLRNLPG